MLCPGYAAGKVAKIKRMESVLASCFLGRLGVRIRVDGLGRSCSMFLLIESRPESRKNMENTGVRLARASRCESIYFWMFFNTCWKSKTWSFCTMMSSPASFGLMLRLRRPQSSDFRSPAEPDTLKCKTQVPQRTRTGNRI